MSVEIKNNLPFGYLIFFLLLAVLIPFIPIEYYTASLLILVFIIYLQGYVTGIRLTPLLNLSFAVFAVGVLNLLVGYLEYEFPIYILAASISINCVGRYVASYIRTRGKKEDELDEKLISATSSIAFILTGTLSAYIVAYWTIDWMDIQVTLSQLFFLVVIGVLAGALLESIPSRTDKNISLVLGTAMVMWLFASFGYYVNFYHLSAAFIFSLFLAFVAYRQNVADVSAMLSAILLGVLIIVFTDLSWYLILITFFLLGGAFTRYRYDYKLMRGIAQSKGGVRSYDNVLSNSAAALVLAIGYGVYHSSHPLFGHILLFAYMGAVATATGDTLASEIGETYRGRPVMITTLEPVRPGTDGGISMLGELVCIGGSAVIGILALVLGVVDLNLPGTGAYISIILIVVLGGFAGTNFDSLLGATLQQKGLLSNSGVNFIATFAGAFISGAAYYMLSGHVV